jgi:hypothetical protein
MMFFTQRKI